MQENEYEAAVLGARNVTVLPAGTVMLNDFPSFAVTVWATSSVFVTVTFFPGNAGPETLYR